MLTCKLYRDYIVTKREANYRFCALALFISCIVPKVTLTKLRNLHNTKFQGHFFGVGVASTSKFSRSFPSHYRWRKKVRIWSELHIEFHKSRPSSWKLAHTATRTEHNTMIGKKQPKQITNASVLAQGSRQTSAEGVPSVAQPMTREQLPVRKFCKALGLHISVITTLLTYN
jgi:hypothetical protein